MIIIRVSLVLVIFLSNQDGNHDGYTTFNQSGNNFNNQNDKRGTVINTTFNQNDTVMNQQNDKRGNNTIFIQNETVMNQQNDHRI